MTKYGAVALRTCKLKLTMTNTTAFVQLQWHNDELTMTKYGAVALRTCKSKLTKRRQGTRSG